MNTFLTEINDEQRLILINALTLAMLTPNDANDPEEVELLIDMLRDLPEIEKETPGVIHGLCR